MPWTVSDAFAIPAFAASAKLVGDEAVISITLATAIGLPPRVGCGHRFSYTRHARGKRGRRPTSGPSVPVAPCADGGVRRAGGARRDLPPPQRGIRAADSRSRTGFQWRYG